MCEDLGVDERQHQELQVWAEALAAATDAERRAMGHALLMLLAQVEALEAELAARLDGPAADAAPPLGVLGASHRQILAVRSISSGGHPIRC